MTFKFFKNFFYSILLLLILSNETVASIKQLNWPNNLENRIIVFYSNKPYNLGNLRSTYKFYPEGKIEVLEYYDDAIKEFKRTGSWKLINDSKTLETKFSINDKPYVIKEEFYKSGSGSLFKKGEGVYEGKKYKFKDLVTEEYFLKDINYNVPFTSSSNPEIEKLFVGKKIELKGLNHSLSINFESPNNLIWERLNDGYGEEIKKRNSGWQIKSFSENEMIMWIAIQTGKSVSGYINFEVEKWIVDLRNYNVDVWKRGIKSDNYKLEILSDLQTLGISTYAKNDIVTNSKVAKKNKDLSKCSINSFSDLLNCSLPEIELSCGYPVTTESTNTYEIRRLSQQNFYSDFFKKRFFRVDLKACEAFGKPFGLKPEVSLLNINSSKELDGVLLLDPVGKQVNFSSDQINGIKVTFKDIFSVVQKNQILMYLEKTYGKKISEYNTSSENWIFFDNYQVGYLYNSPNVSVIYSDNVISNYFKNEIIRKSKLKPQNENQL